MDIGTDLSAINGLTSLIASTGGMGVFGGGGAVLGSDFGPAALLSLGQGDLDSGGVDYTSLAALSMQLQSQPVPQISPKQIEHEKEIIKQATVMRVNGMYDEAREVLNDLLKDNPRNGVAVHALGAIELDLGNYDKAEAYFRKADYLAPEYGFGGDVANAQILQHDDDYVLEQARRMTSQPGTGERGNRLLVALTHRSPSNAEARVLLAESLINTGDATNGLTQYQLAISTANKSQLQIIETKLSGLLKGAPKSAYLNNLLGQTQLRLGKHEQAAATLSRASQLGDYDQLYLSDEALAQAALGRDALHVGDITRAMGFFRTAERLDPFATDVKLAMAEGLTARALWRSQMGDMSTAIDDFKSAISKLGTAEDDELRDKIAQGLYSAGLRLERRRLRDGTEVGKEVVAFQAAYDLDPDNLTYARKLAETRVALGDEHMADGDYDDAAYSYKAAYELQPHNADYKQAAIDAFLAYGDERSAIFDHHEAIEAYQEAYDLDKTNESSKFKLAEAFNTRGIWYRSLGNDYYEDAASDFLSALDLYPDNEDYQDNYDSVT